MSTGEKPLDSSTQAPVQAEPRTDVTAFAALGIVYGALVSLSLYTCQTFVGTVGGRCNRAAIAGRLGAELYRSRKWLP